MEQVLFTVVVVLALLLAEFGSGVVEETLAESLITVPLGVPILTCTTRVKTCGVAGARFGLVQVMFPVPLTGGVEQFHPAGAFNDWKVDEQFGFSKSRTPVVGLDEIITDCEKEDVKLLLGWDIWSGFYVMADSEAGDAIVDEVGKYLNSIIQEPQFESYIHRW